MKTQKRNCEYICDKKKMYVSITAYVLIKVLIQLKNREDKRKKGKEKTLPA